MRKRSDTLDSRYQGVHTAAVRLDEFAALVSREGWIMKLIRSLLIAVCVLSGCTTTGTTDTIDDPAPTGAGPALCHDGTPPPCTIRD
jgi:hypothetical protein